MSTELFSSWRDTWKMHLWVVPGKYLASAIDKTLITILKNKLDKKSRETNAHELFCHRNHNEKQTCTSA